jgi:hypothetical protein
MRVDPANQAMPAEPGDFGREFAREQQSVARETKETRALVVTEAATAPQRTPVYREAAFLAHLIATKSHAPQTRERRRAEPSEAIAAYRTVKALTA